ncbi:MotA/TolQ/ExbB proton channel family protein [Rhodobacteraceae bacterium RKSG542]|uniref:MotA/TolQ/ExbB proton channel family protein n=1 Tax=Pseudovibrio flavus TaxID=2529854 RepID=UPI0012BBB821|nr:MotA/TolQ/ExbB proton channel family protein [Pseudovibrio flavus]MTI17124.1 MotA/TolQ/ExbB proton channel family protein [Pseudovibrio flavus]
MPAEIVNTELLNHVSLILKPLAEFVEMGGAVVAILLGLSVISLTLILAKAMEFMLSGVGRGRKSAMAADLWTAGKAKAAISFAAHHRSPVSKVLSFTLQELADGERELETLKEDIERVASEHISKLRRNLRGLEVIAQIAPLLGLFGTVLGMITAFQAMADAGAQVNPADLANGIWVALLTTAAGLAVAIPTSITLAFFESRVEREQVAMEQLVTRVVTANPQRSPLPA